MRGLLPSDGGVCPGDAVGIGGKSSYISRSGHTSRDGLSGDGGADDVDDVGGAFEHAPGDGEDSSCTVRGGGDHAPRTKS